jgi:hypothetical protein
MFDFSARREQTQAMGISIPTEDIEKFLHNFYTGVLMLIYSKQIRWL